MRGQRSGTFTMRRMEETPAARSVCAITSLAAIMKSSIRCAARLLCRAAMSVTLPLLITGSRFHAVEGQRAQTMAGLTQRYGSFVLQLELRLQVRRRGHFGRRA